MKQLPALIRGEINRTAHFLAQLEVARIKTELVTLLTGAQSAGASTNDLIELLRARSAHARETF